MPYFILMFFVSALVACSDNSTSSAPASQVSEPVLPADPVLAELYAGTCQSCHGVGIGDAPVAGDSAAWQPRLAKGMDTLLNNTISGFGGMPPLGSCSDCNEEDFLALIEFMTSPAGEAL